MLPLINAPGTVLAPILAVSWGAFLVLMVLGNHERYEPSDWIDTIARWLAAPMFLWALYVSGIAAGRGTCA